MNILKTFTKNDNGDKDWPQIFIIIIVSLASFNNGTLFAWTSPSIPILTSDSSHMEPLTVIECSYFTILSPIGILIAAPLASTLANLIGNKCMIMVMSIPQIVAWTLIIFSTSKWELYVSRAVIGIGEAILFSSVPAYIGEISTPHVRGVWGNCVSICFFSGHLFVNIVGSYCSIITTAVIFIWLPFVVAILVHFFPESPHYYLRKSEMEKAKRSLQLLRWREDVNEELHTFADSVQGRRIGTWKELFIVANNRTGMIIAIITKGFQPFCGYAVIAFYNQYIFQAAGGTLSASESAITYSGLQIAFVIIFLFFCERIGRRRALIFSSLGCAVAMIIVAVYFYINLNALFDITLFNWVPLLGLILYVLSFSFGLSTLPTLMLSEVIAHSIKNYALCVINQVYAVVLLASSAVFNVLNSKYSIYSPFCFYAVCNVIAVIVFYIQIPETKGKTLDEIQQHIKNTKAKHKKKACTNI
ncbi:hypothetical protein FQA39_LY07604 [Lamprigera yunnana]|nr:hypothetical protein FQA39_LY07604 [Lamprigera yunnana]